MEYKEIELLKQSAKSAVHLVRGGQAYVRQILAGHMPAEAEGSPYL